tara:strand:+ start:336 stop:1178 length:843 start_codon:yes stop_codon:yes gene_type:complete
LYKGLEDEFGDIVGKARRGQELSEEAVSRAVDVTQREWTRIERYEWVPEENLVVRIADVLGLSHKKLIGSAQGEFYPKFPMGKPLKNTRVEMMILGHSFRVNGYLVGCHSSGKALCVDPGFDGEKIRHVAERADLQIEQIVLTHGHHDHIGALKSVTRDTSARVYINREDLPLMGELKSLVDSTLSEGDILGVGKLNFIVCATGGHTPGGISLVGEEVAFVGDALFAGSLGGTRQRKAYEAQQDAVDRHILGLREEVLLFPGHGPATTVGEERAHNPFFL